MSIETQTLRSLEKRELADLQPFEMEPPIFKWLPVENLMFDDRYQRPLTQKNWQAIKKIAINFNWKHFSSVEVADLENGSYSVIDGQHRAHAAAMVGITHVPCLVHIMSLQEQAAAFAAINGNVINMTTFSMFRAALVGGEEWAKKIDDCASSADCKIMQSNSPEELKEPGEIYCIQYLRKKIKNNEYEQLKFALTCLRKSAWGQSKYYYSYIWIRAISEALIERFYRFKDQSDEVIEALNIADLDTIEEQASQQYKVRRRQGITCGFSKWELMRALIGTHLDKQIKTVMLVG